MLPPRLTPWLQQLQDLTAPLRQAIAQQASSGIFRYPALQQLARRPLGSRSWGSLSLSSIALGLAVLAGCTGLLLWDAKLLLATAAGLGAVALVYPAPRWDWQPWLTRLRASLLSGQTSPQRLLVRCVASGGLAMVSTYMGASIWQRSQDGWLVACLLFQGMGLLALLGWTWLQGTRQSPMAYTALSFDEALVALAQPQPLGRLLAVRQLHRLSRQRRLSPEEQRTASQALQLLLLQEPEAAVREAALRSLGPSLMAPSITLDSPDPRPSDAASG